MPHSASLRISTQLLKKHPPHSIPVIKQGHLNQTRNNQRSTQTPADPTPPTAILEPPSEIKDEIDMFPPSKPNKYRTHFCYTIILEPTGQIYTDQTGKFIAPSSNGHNYIMILYDYDSNALLSEPMPSRTGKSILAAYKVLHA